MNENVQIRNPDEENNRWGGYKIGQNHIYLPKGERELRAMG